MEAAILVAIFSGVFVAIFMLLVSASLLSEKQREAAHDKRMAEHRMNARLLRLNIS
jgi:hypothetical protein